ncbi:MAG: sugar phosphate isomerase/epimerase [Ruminococcaceae bacterium]|nr:sugar phosphate isomerase/epimerase [Oscillospiraceae bacterium]
MLQYIHRFTEKETKMEFGFYVGFNRLFESMDPVSVLSTAKKMGYSFFEPLHSSRLYLKNSPEALKEAMAETGVGIHCYSVGLNIFTQKGLDTAKECLRIASFLGAEHLHHTMCFSLTEKNNIDDIISPTAKNTAAVCDMAKELGMNVLVENQGLVFNGADNLSRLFEAVNRDNFFFCSDLGNSLFVGEDHIHAAKRFMHLTKHVHVKDYRFTAEGPYRTPDSRAFEEVIPGEGDLPLRELLGLYKDKSIPISVEYSCPEAQYEKALNCTKALL